MACMGPSKEYAELRGEEAFKEVLALLLKYGVVRTSDYPEMLEDATEMQKWLCNLSKRNQEEWDEKAEVLKLAIVDLIWHQQCMDF